MLLTSPKADAEAGGRRARGPEDIETAIRRYEAGSPSGRWPVSYRSARRPWVES